MGADPAKDSSLISPWGASLKLDCPLEAASIRKAWDAQGHNVYGLLDPSIKERDLQFEVLSGESLFQPATKKLKLTSRPKSTPIKKRVNQKPKK